MVSLSMFVFIISAILYSSGHRIKIFEQCQERIQTHKELNAQEKVGKKDDGYKAGCI